MRWQDVNDLQPYGNIRMLTTHRWGMSMLPCWAWLWKIYGVTHWKNPARAETQRIMLHSPVGVENLNCPLEIIEAAEDLEDYMKDQELTYFSGLGLRSQL